MFSTQLLQKLVSQTAFDKTLPVVGANQVINEFLNNIGRAITSEGDLVAGMRNGEVVQLRVGGLTLGQHIKQLFATEQQGSFIANLINKLTNGQINIVVADQLPATLGDGNQFAGMYRDATTGQETVYITREAWDKIALSDKKAPDNKAYALIGAVIRAAALLEGRNLDVSELFTKDISQRIWTNNIGQQYEALFFSELPMEQALKTRVE